MSDLRNSLSNEFQDADYRYPYAEGFLNTRLAAQIKTLREQRKKTQAEIAAAMGIKQTGYRRFEDVNHSVWKTDSLWSIARALGVRLNISFETFGSLIQEKENFNRQSLECPPFEEDPAFSTGSPAAIAPERSQRPHPEAPQADKLTDRFSQNPSTAANNVHFEASAWDLKILFGQLNQSENPATVDQHTAITLAWPEAKVAAYYLLVQLISYERENGTISVPRTAIPGRPDSANPDVLPENKPVFAYVAWVYDQFFGSDKYVPPSVASFETNPVSGE